MKLSQQIAALPIPERDQWFIDLYKSEPLVKDRDKDRYHEQLKAFIPTLHNRYYRYVVDVIDVADQRRIDYFKSIKYEVFQVKFKDVAAYKIAIFGILRIRRGKAKLPVKKTRRKSRVKRYNPNNHNRYIR